MKLCLLYIILVFLINIESAIFPNLSIYISLAFNLLFIEFLMALTSNHKVNQAVYRKKHRIRLLVKKAKRRIKWEFSIDEEHIKELCNKQNNKCALSGIEFNNDSSIDRIDSSKGYTKDNVQLLLTDINRMKRNFSDEKFITLCKLVAENNK